MGNLINNPDDIDLSREFLTAHERRFTFGHPAIGSFSGYRSTSPPSRQLAGILHNPPDLLVNPADHFLRADLLKAFAHTGNQLDERSAAPLPVKRNTKEKNLEPLNKNSIGYTVWLIIGGPNAHFAQAAQHLDVATSSLKSIIYGRLRITQTALDAKGWRDQLATHYPEGWEKWNAQFDQRALELNTRSGAQHQNRRDDHSFGYSFWLILGGDAANIALASRQMGMHEGTLRNILAGRRGMTTDEQRVASLALADHYTEAWDRLGPEFLSRALDDRCNRARDKEAAAFLAGQGRKISGDLDTELKSDVARFVWRTLRQRGDRVRDILPYVSTPFLRRTEAWWSMFFLETNTPKVYRQALREVCRIYDFDPTEPAGDYARVQNFLARLHRPRNDHA